MCRTSSINLANQPTLGSFLTSHIQSIEESYECNKPPLATDEDSWIEQITFSDERSVSNDQVDYNCGSESLISENVSVESNEKNTTNEGRWTFEEHNCFLEGLRTYGKSWRKLSTMIPTRTVLQIRTHAQKYMLKLLRAKQKHLTLDRIVYSDFEILNSKSGNSNKRKCNTEDDWENLISALGNYPSNYYQPFLTETCPEISIKKQKSEVSFTMPYENPLCHTDYQNIPNMGDCSPSSVASALLDQNTNYYQQILTITPATTYYQQLQTAVSDIDKNTNLQYYEVSHKKTGLVLQYLSDDSLDALFSYQFSELEDMQLFDVDINISEREVASMFGDHQSLEAFATSYHHHQLSEQQEPITQTLCYTQQNSSF